MKKFYYILFLITIIFGSFFIVTRVNAQNPALTQELIQNFLATISVNKDNSIDVLEFIIYNTGPQERHGIYRDIYPYSSAGRKMGIKNISVVDEQDTPYNFTVSNVGSNIRIKIGDPDKTFSGKKTYIIKYHATKAVAQLKDIDEIYWNVTGNEWLIPIYQSQLSVALPNGAEMTQSACYYGPRGSTEKCWWNNGYLMDHSFLFERPHFVFDGPSLLNRGEGLTVAVGFPKGIVTPYSLTDKFSDLLYLYWPWLVAGLLPILTLIFSLWYWYKNGRDPKGTGVIVPQYDVPDGLIPMEVAGIMNEKVIAKDISAEIIYLATKGYLKITQTEEKILGLFKSTDYELSKLKDYSDLPNVFDRQLLVGILTSKDLFSQSQVIKLSDLKNKFYTTTASIIESVLSALISKGYYKSLGLKKSVGRTSIFVALFALVAKVSIFFVAESWFFLYLGSAVLSLIIYKIVSQFFPAKTEKGVAIKEHLLGLKDYLQIAEKDRLLFHNAPEKKPEVFEKLLPYAMVLGVANIWAKEFEGIYTTPPSWYSGSTGSVFNAVYFSNSLSHFSSFASSSMSSSPSSSGGGSGGGGSSGGGGGGGGGGGW